QGVVAVEERREDRIVEVRAEAIEEGLVREGLRGVLEPARQVQEAERERPVLGDRRGEDVELLVAEHVAEGDLRAAEDVAAAGHADIDRGPPVEEQLLEGTLPLRVLRD